MSHFFTFKKGLLSLFTLIKLNMVSPPKMPEHFTVLRYQIYIYSLRSCLLF